MSALLDQFLAETRDVLQDISARLLALESQPDSVELMSELFRLVHTLKGSSGLFDFPEMTRVLHAAEDLMVVVREGRVAYSRVFADQLLLAMDFVAMLVDEVESSGRTGGSHAAESANLAEALRLLIGDPAASPELEPVMSARSAALGAAARAMTAASAARAALSGGAIAEAIRVEAHGRALAGAELWWLTYTPVEDCYYQGADPLFQARNTPGALWGAVRAREPWPGLTELDAYRCVLVFDVLCAAPLAELEEHYRYMLEQVSMSALSPRDLIGPHGEADAQPVSGAVAGESPGAAPSGAAVPRQGAVSEAFERIVETQRQILGLPDGDAWQAGRLRAVAATLDACQRADGRPDRWPDLDAALASALHLGQAAPLLAALERGLAAGARAGTTPVVEPDAAAVPDAGLATTRLARRDDGSPGPAAVLKVEQVKIDRLMNLIGEMVVAKNSLPYLASRAESRYGVPELGREIKAQYSVINRIAEEMQDAIMQVRMMPVSFVLQRFPRLVRDVSRKLGKEVRLVLEGESTEADKNIIEALADPLIHIVRNSLDHGLESPEERRAAGKPAEGRLTIRASQEADRVVIEISDDGKGIDPAVIRRKALQNGLVDEEQAKRMSDQEAINLVFAAGLSTAAVVSDLSGRGVGMDVVRSAVSKVNGSIRLDSEVGKGTRIRLSLPLSMAVSSVIIVESNGQIFGVPMDVVVETVRVPRASIRSMKQRRAAVLRGRIVPLLALNDLLAVGIEQRASDDDELATLVVRLAGEHVGIVVDDFRETVNVILKPLTGILGHMSGYAGSALMGDGSVLLVLNLRELV